MRKLFVPKYPYLGTIRPWVYYLAVNCSTIWQSASVSPFHLPENFPSFLLPYLILIWDFGGCQKEVRAPQASHLEAIQSSKCSPEYNSLLSITGKALLKDPSLRKVRRSRQIKHLNSHIMKKGFSMENHLRRLADAGAWARHLNSFLSPGWEALWQYYRTVSDLLVTPYFWNAGCKARQREGCSWHTSCVPMGLALCRPRCNGP